MSLAFPQIETHDSHRVTNKIFAKCLPPETMAEIYNNNNNNYYNTNHHHVKTNISANNTTRDSCLASCQEGIKSRRKSVLDCTNSENTFLSYPMTDSSSPSSCWCRGVTGKPFCTSTLAAASGPDDNDISDDYCGECCKITP